MWVLDSVVSMIHEAFEPTQVPRGVMKKLSDYEVYVGVFSTYRIKGRNIVRTNLFMGTTFYDGNGKKGCT